MKQKVLIENAIFHAKHGVFPEEKVIGGRFEVSLEMETDFTQAAMHDDLRGTVNYADVYDLIEKEIKKPAKLIEHLGHRILNQLKQQHPNVTSARLKLSKCAPPISGEVEKVSVVIEV